MTAQSPAHAAAVSGIVLAAGSGRRMGHPKASIEIDGVRLVDRAVATLRSGGCDELICVVRTGVDVPGALNVVNPDPDRGMGSSLRLGLEAASGKVAVIALVDTPGLEPEAVRAVLAAGGPLAVATYEGRRGHPVAIARTHWAEVAALADGDHGARPFMRAHPDLVTEVACTGDPSDLDTPADVTRWQAAR